MSKPKFFNYVFSKTFNSVHRSKMEKILIAYFSIFLSYNIIYLFSLLSITQLNIETTTKGRDDTTPMALLKLYQPQ